MSDTPRCDAFFSVDRAANESADYARQLERELAEAKKDAARYRWLLEKGEYIEQEKHAIECRLLPAGETYPSLDAAIDAAIARERAEGECNG